MCKMCVDDICTNRCVPQTKTVDPAGNVAREFLATDPTQAQKDIFFKVLQLLRENNRNTNRCTTCLKKINQTDSAMNQTKVLEAVVIRAITKPSKLKSIHQP